MLEFKERGIVGLPVILLLCIFLTVSVVGLGMRGLSQANRFRNSQRSVNSFNRFVETSRKVAFGGIGDGQKIRLDLTDAEISVSSREVRLEGSNEILKVEYLPLPMLKNGKSIYNLQTGVYFVSLTEPVENFDSDLEGRSLVLRISEVS